MKVISIGQDVEFANQIYKFTLENCVPNAIQFVEDNDGNLVVNEGILNDPAFQKFPYEIIGPITNYSIETDIAPVVYTGFNRVKEAMFTVDGEIDAVDLGAELRAKNNIKGTL